MPAAWPRIDESGQHRQRSGAGDEQRLECCRTRSSVGVVVADQEERRDRRQLPEAVEHEQVVGQDQPEHRAGEQRQQRHQAAEPGAFGREVRQRRRRTRARRCRRRAPPSAPRSRRVAGRDRCPSAGIHSIDSVTGSPSSTLGELDQQPHAAPRAGRAPRSAIHACRAGHPMPTRRGRARRAVRAGRPSATDPSAARRRRPLRPWRDDEILVSDREHDRRSLTDVRATDQTRVP